MRKLKNLFDNNQAWAARVEREHPGFFEELRAQQSPQFLWIGCSDSRVPANEIVGLMPGELFVHRNVANLVVHTDINCLSVIQFAVEMLRVRHIIVCGHYGCGGVRAALDSAPHGLIDNWLRHIKDVYAKHEQALAAITDPQAREDRLCELNVVEQVFNACYTSFVQDAWAAGRELSVHGWMYGLHDGRLIDLNVCVSGPGEITPVYRLAVGDKPFSR